jgi:protein MpaA
MLLIAAAAGVAALLLVAPSPEQRLQPVHAPASGVDPLVRHRLVLGRSVDRRPIVAVALGDSDAPRSLLVVGAIHGNETAGITIVRRLERTSPPRQGMLWIVPDLNPDGVAANTRQNAHGVDLNRNFPWHWRHRGHRGELQYPGPRALSEPESRIARDLILRVRPGITIWLHPLGVVDESGGNSRVERRFSRMSRMPLKRLRRYPGSAASWQDHRLGRTTAFVVELPLGRLSRPLLARLTGVVHRLDPPRVG